MNEPPRESVHFWLSPERAMSVPPPGWKPTTMRTGFRDYGGGRAGSISKHERDAGHHSRELSCILPVDIVNAVCTRAALS